MARPLPEDPEMPTREEMERFVRDPEAIRRAARLYFDGLMQDAQSS